jgi:hypothetical protein
MLFQFTSAIQAAIEAGKKDERKLQKSGKFVQKLVE